MKLFENILKAAIKACLHAKKYKVLNIKYHSYNIDLKGYKYEIILNKPLQQQHKEIIEKSLNNE